MLDYSCNNILFKDKFILIISTKKKMYLLTVHFDAQHMHKTNIVMQNSCFIYA